jgi:hypothetical protein
MVCEICTDVFTEACAWCYDFYCSEHYEEHISVCEDRKEWDRKNNG